MTKDAPTWLLDDPRRTAQSASLRKAASGETWNGQDWYANFGDELDGRNWEDAVQYGFISAGGSPWYSRSLQALPEGGRVFVYLPGNGYVGVGTVTGPAQPFDAAAVLVNAQPQPLSELPLRGQYSHPPSTDGSDTAEYVVPVDWIRTRPRQEAVRGTGLFANQNSACRLRNEFTLNRLAEEFQLEDDEVSSSGASTTD